MKKKTTIDDVLNESDALAEQIMACQKKIEEIEAEKKALQKKRYAVNTKIHKAINEKVRALWEKQFKKSPLCVTYKQGNSYSEVLIHDEINNFKTVYVMFSNQMTVRDVVGEQWKFEGNPYNEETTQIHLRLLQVGECALEDL